MRRTVLTSLLFAATASVAAAAIAWPSGPPSITPHPVVDQYPGGHSVVDPYRYLQNLKSPKVQAYFKAQANYSSDILAQLGSGRERLRADIGRLVDAVPRLSDFARVEDRLFYLERPAGVNDARLMVRIANAAPRVLLDPDALGRQMNSKAHLSISQILPSPDGTRVAVSLVPGGAEFETYTRILDVATAAITPETLEHTWFGVTSWSPDGTAIYYNNPPAAALLPGHEHERELNAHTYKHVLGSSGPDPVVFGSGIDPKVPFDPIDQPVVAFPLGSDYALGVISHGVQNELTIYTAPARAVLAGGTIPWRKVADSSDDVIGYDVRGNSLYLQTHKDALRYKITSIDLSDTSAVAANAPTIVPEGPSVIQAIGVAHDALYIKGIDAGLATLRKLPWSSDGRPSTAANIALPFSGSVDDLALDPRVDGAVIGLTSWVKPKQIYFVDAAGTVADAGIVPLPTIDLSQYTSVEVRVPSTGGALVPVSITMKRGVRLDGSAPVYLQAYGAYGFDIDPGFLGTQLAWVDAGGIYVVAHVRGGGENGEGWHRDGEGPTKQHTIDDAIATARWLIANKYTSPEHLAIEGTSAGGIMVGGAITQHPELFAAAIDGVGVTDALRSIDEPNGEVNFPEFGDPRTLSGFNDLYKMDAYVHIVDGKRYPAVLGITGINDPRVAPWQVAKFITRLQHATSSGRPVLMRVDYDAGHGLLGASRAQTVALKVDEFSFLLWQCGSPLFANIPMRHVAMR